jgi:hypothetical protein
MKTTYLSMTVVLSILFSTFAMALPSKCPPVTALSKKDNMWFLSSEYIASGWTVFGAYSGTTLPLNDLARVYLRDKSQAENATMSCLYSANNTIGYVYAYYDKEKITSSDLANYTASSHWQHYNGWATCGARNNTIASCSLTQGQA